MTSRFYVISVVHGLVATADDADRAEELAIIAAVNSGRTIYLHDRLTEI